MTTHIITDNIKQSEDDMKQSSRVKTCGWCQYFKPHKSITGYANGYWLGDGNCKSSNKQLKQPIPKSMGDTCPDFKIIKP